MRLWNPDSFANSANTCELNGGLLSVCKVSGTPWVEKISFSFLLVASNDVVVTNSTSGYLEYWSVTTKAYCPLGNGPQKSASPWSFWKGRHLGWFSVFCLRGDLALETSLHQVFNL